VTSGTGPPWWSDALNDPWRDPESDAVIVTKTPGAQEPPPPFRENAGPLSAGPRMLVVVAVVSGLLAGALGATIGYVAAAGRSRTIVVGEGSRTAPTPVRPPDSLPALITQVMPSVVTVEGSSSTGSSVGSGFVIADNGYILTNEHVISGMADDSLKVTMSDASTAAATVVGRDPESDLAVLKINRDNLRAVDFADSDTVAVGDGVVAIGSPLALPGTVTTGIVSALDRTIETQDAHGVQRYYAAIQTDAAINRGNSGGPLFDMNGRVIGVNSVIKSTAEGDADAGNIGIAFAIPINQAARLATDIIDTGKSHRTVIGADFDTYAGPGGGAKLISVDAAGPAAAAGMRMGDIIIRIGTHVVQEPHDVIALIRRYDPGTTVTITYRRGTVTQAATVKLVADAN